eukprot:Filipodium_phascolosomae@DN649_c0_g1_i1.p1
MRVGGCAFGVAAVAAGTGEAAAIVLERPTSSSPVSGVSTPPTTTTATATTAAATTLSTATSGATKFLRAGRHQLPVVSKTFLTHDVVRVRLALPSPTSLFGLPCGMHVRIFGPNNLGSVTGMWNGKSDRESKMKEISRKYTPITGDDCPGHVDVVVKVYKGKVKPQFPDGGKLSQYIGSLQPGDLLSLEGPSGTVEYLGCGHFKNRNKDVHVRKMCMMAGGAGITPILRVVHEVLNNPNDKCQMSLIFANQTVEDIFMKEHIEELANKCPKQFRVWYTLDHAPPGWAFSEGFITQEMISERLFPPAPDVAVLMCGPPPMIKFACKANLEKLKYPESNWLEF